MKVPATDPSMWAMRSHIKAKFEDGVLKISVLKKEAKPEVEEKKFIAIEG